MKYLSILALAALVAVPAVASAQFGGLTTFIGNFSILINNTLVPLAFAVGFLLFLYGTFLFFVNPGEEDKAKGKSYMLYAVIGFFFAVSIFGITNLISAGFGFQSENLQNLPNAPTTNL